VLRLKASLLILLVFLTGCSWFHRTRSVAPDPPQLIVTGLAPGTLLFIDGVQSGQPQDKNYRSRVVDVTPGMHTVEVKMGDTITYQESTYAGPGDKRSVTVLSGNSRN
jgi:hypothetical protein